ncbi:radical SAM/SPASM domain-containing protein [Natribaculum luteum]|uniref:Radical SAM/SPASM domain-containing protein n=1 Tax=Natribaculum luteum TaxID=1586232 RepID=A0ABD5P024_9EURY|nr:radical SAM/SPASM domain-containing protein [Natribaculum luteum]
MQVSTLSMFLDYKCNFECGHCSVGSSPETEYELDDRYIDKALSEADSLESLQLVVFTGGEVTLHFDKLLDAISQASECGYRTRIVTNAWWAHDIERARETIDRLVDAGLDEINTSYDDFHTDYAPPDNIVNFVEASLESDIEQTSVAMIIGDTNPRYDAEAMVKLLERRLGTHPDAYSDELTVLEDTVSPLGRGAQIDVSELTARNDVDSGCSDVISTISVHPDGTVKACCGHAQWYVPDLTLGSLDEQSLPDIVQRSQENLLYWLVHNVGPQQLLERIGVEGDYSGICHACNDLLGEHREKLLEYIRTNKQQLVHEDLFLSETMQRDAQSLVDHEQQVLERLDRISQAADAD